MFIATIVLSILLALAYVGAGGAKVAGTKLMMEGADHFGISRTAYRGIGALELAGALGLVVGLRIGPLGTAAAVCLAVLMVGAVATHVRAHDPFSRAAAPAVLAVLAVVTAVLHLAGG